MTGSSPIRRAEPLCNCLPTAFFNADLEQKGIPMNPIVTIIPAYNGCEIAETDGSGERFAIIAWQITQNGDDLQVRPISARGLEPTAGGEGGVYINGEIQ